MRQILAYSLSLAVGVAASFGATFIEPCCSVVSLNATTRSVTAIDRASAKLFTFTVTSPAMFRAIRVGDKFDASFGRVQKGMTFAANFGQARPIEPCCGLTSDIGGAGQALGVRMHEASGVDVVLMELKRTSGNTVTARWLYLNGSDDALKFEEKGCVGMGCTYTLAEDMHFIDGATRMKHEVLRDDSNQAIAQRYESGKLGVAPHAALSSWAKFNAPPASSTTVTVIIPGVSEPFEDVPIGG